MSQRDPTLPMRSARHNRRRKMSTTAVQLRIDVPKAAIVSLSRSGVIDALADMLGIRIGSGRKDKEVQK
jgi:hypothetical protein